MDYIQISIGLLGIIIATIQTVRLRQLRKIRDTHLRLLWQNAKELSRRLLNMSEEEYPRKSCGVRSQRIEESIATLIVYLSNVNRKTVEKWLNNGDIDAFDYELLKKLTL